MPTYEYLCLECGYKFEEFQGINDPAVETCPYCSGKVKRLIGHGGGLIFKGSGFYVTDYKNYGKNKIEKEKVSTESSKKEEKNPQKSKES